MQELAVGVRSSQLRPMGCAFCLLFSLSGLGKFINWARWRSMLLNDWRLLGRYLGFRKVNCCGAHLFFSLKLCLKDLCANASVCYGLVCRAWTPDIMCEA